ncbi:MAG: putative transposase [Limisphaerales bacterium]
MNGNSRRVWSIGNGLREATQVLRYGLKFFRCFFQSKAVLAAKVTALESQIEILQERAESQGIRRFRFNEAFRFLWVILSTTWGGWKSVCRVMQPRTVTKWHERVFRFFWKWKCALGVGRPPIDVELQELIAQMSRENRLWGAKTIRDQLVLLGYRKLAIQTVRKYMIDDKGRGRGSSTWLAFLRNHLSVTWGMDFMTLTTLGFKCS